MSCYNLLPLLSVLALVMLLAAPISHAAPAWPEDLQVEVGKDYVDLWWQPSENATHYSVYRGTGAGGMVRVANVSAPITAYHDGGLVDGSSYIYYITAVNEEGESAPGPSVAATVPTKESQEVLVPVLALVLSTIAIQICAIVLLYLFKGNMRPK